MKHIEIVKSVRISGTNYTNARAAAKRWVEAAAQAIYNRRCAGLHYTDPRARQAWLWARDQWVCGGKHQRHWRRVVPIMEKLLK